jgi:UDP-glucose 4-epimerase
MGEDHDPETHLIPLVLSVAQGKREEIKVFGLDYPTDDGTCVRDYVHVEDLAGIHRLALDTQEEGKFRCYNVGTGAGVSVKGVIEAAREVTGHEIPASPASRREGDPPQLYADPTKVVSEFDWQPKYTDIREIIATAWHWHRTHPNGYGDVKGE